MMPSTWRGPADSEVAVCAEALRVLAEADVPCLVGGSFAYTQFTGVARPTKDLDLFVRRASLPAALAALGAQGFDTAVPYPHWLAKAGRDGTWIDIIFSSGNGVAIVDDEWWTHAADGVLFDDPVKVCPLEELIWSKAFVMERERYDGADVAHLIRARGHVIDWARLRHRFAPYQMVLASHLLLFHFIYADAAQLVPPGLLGEVLADVSPPVAPAGDAPVCWGTLLSREQYLPDIERIGYRDARLAMSTMEAEAIAIWTAAIAQPDDLH